MDRLSSVALILLCPKHRDALHDGTVRMDVVMHVGEIGDLPTNEVDGPVQYATPIGLVDQRVYPPSQTIDDIVLRSADNVKSGFVYFDQGSHSSLVLHDHTDLNLAEFQFDRPVDVKSGFEVTRWKRGSNENIANGLLSLRFSNAAR